MEVRKVLCSVGLAACMTTLSAQVDSLALRYAGTIGVQELKDHLSILASDAYQGRDTGKEGQKMAAAYLKAAFIEMGIPPVPAPDPASIVDGYYQPFELIEERNGNIFIQANGKEHRFMEDLFYFSENLGTDLVVQEALYLKQGTDARTAKGKAAEVVIMDDPGNSGAALIVALRMRVEVAAGLGAKVVLVPTDRLDMLKAELGHAAGSAHLRLVDGVRQETSTRPQLILVDAAAMSGMLRKGDLRKVQRKGPGRKVLLDMVVQNRSTDERVISENVLAFIEGTEKKDEVLVITAHYDHVGVEDGVIYNGADDDGSGTVALLEIAEAFALARKAGHGPLRSVLVMPVSGEEKGLLGSRYYSEHPVFPLANTVADLNIDMIGRRDTAHAASEPYVYVIGSDRLSSELHAVNEEANRTYTQLDLDYTFNEKDDPNRFYYRSDHYNFARKGIPSIFYFSGVHEDYHQPGDDVEKIEFDLLHQRTLLVFHTAWALANRNERPVVDKAEGP